MSKQFKISGEAEKTVEVEKPKTETEETPAVEVEPTGYKHRELRVKKDRGLIRVNNRRLRGGMRVPSEFLKDGVIPERNRDDIEEVK